MEFLVVVSFAPLTLARRLAGPRFAPWAAFFRRFAAVGSGRLEPTQLLSHLVFAYEPRTDECAPLTLFSFA